MPIKPRRVQLSFYRFFFYLKKAQHSFIFLANVNINNFYTLQP